MAVSLKKPEMEEKKLPEYTPIHLIDEEETIKNRPVRSVTPKEIENVSVKRSDSSEVLKETLLNKAAEYEAERNKQKKWHVLAWFGSFALVIAVFVAVFFLAVNMPFKPVETPTEDITANKAAFQFIFSSLTSVLGYLSHNPLFMLLFSLSLLGFAVSCIKRIMRG